MTYTIQITEPQQDEGLPPYIHYVRRIEVASIDAVIKALDASLNGLPKPRKRRAGAGKQP